ncbi:MAG: hypothetical protein HC867_06930 [Bacteroidia bacterium]|nr:hypothetical protein [Bacteroidia bacterium]
MKNIHNICFITIAVFFFLSCNKKLETDISESHEYNDDALYNTFISLGINPQSIKDRGKYYEVFHDLLFEKGNVDIELVRKYFKEN